MAEYRKVNSVLFLILAFMFLSYPLFSQPFVADSSVAKEEVLRKIPVEYINKARSELVIAYQHTSHGTHVSRGVFGLQDYKTGDTLLFGVSETPAADSLEFRDYALEDYAPSGVTAIDLSVDETAFIQTSRNYLDAPENSTVNVIMWSWCNINGHDAAGNYLPGMDLLVNEYGPGGTKIGTGEGQRELPVTFVFMTGHANVDANTGTPTRPKEQADTITSHCKAVQQYCLDYYSIDTHDMDDNYWEDAGDDGNSTSYGGNFYHDWQDSHILGEDYYENKRAPGGSVAYGEHTTQHITSNRKAYAMWWILARIAGWNGDTATAVSVTGIEISSSGDVSEIETADTLRFSAIVLPDSATNQELTWSVTNGSGSALIAEDGLLTAGNPGTVTVVATAMDDSGVTAFFALSILPPLIPVSSLEISSAGNVSELNSGDELQFSLVILPADATNKEVDWSVIDGTGTAVISPEGLVFAGNAGSVAIVARTKDGTFKSDTFYLTIATPVTPVSGITVTPAGGVTSLVSGSILQFSAAILPENASNKTVDWTLSNGLGTASISETGLLTAGNPGLVTVLATARDGSYIRGSFVLTITDPVVMVNSITVSSTGDVSELESGTSLQFSSVVLPFGATNTEITWSVTDETGTASISGTGLLTAGNPGTVAVVATALDGSGVHGTFNLHILSPSIEVTNIQIAAEGSVSQIEAGEMLQLYALVSPSDAINRKVVWNVTSTIKSTGLGTITEGGMFIALAEGDVDVVAVAQDGSGVFDQITLTVLGPTAIEADESEALILYPNPGKDLFFLNTGDLEVERVLVINAIGTVVQEYIPGPGEKFIELDLSRQQTGIYFIKAFADDRFFVKRAILSK